MRNDEHGRLDRAIDRAVRGMMEVDPASGLRHRVSDRLEQPARQRWLLPAVAAACVLLVAAVGAILLRPAPATPTAAPPVVTASPAQPTPATPAAGSAVAPRTTGDSASSTAAKPDAADRRHAPRANPIFGASDGRVRAADAGANARDSKIKLEVTIVDQKGVVDPARKTYTMLMADGVRGGMRVAHDTGGQSTVPVSVQARPLTLPDGGIRVNLDLEYNPRTPGATAPVEWSSMSRQVQVVLEPGKPQVVTQAADPASDRRILIELRATIVKGPRER